MLLSRNSHFSYQSNEQTQQLVLYKKYLVCILVFGLRLYRSQYIIYLEAELCGGSMWGDHHLALIQFHCVTVSEEARELYLKMSPRYN